MHCYDALVEVVRREYILGDVGWRVENSGVGAGNGSGGSDGNRG